MSKPSQSSVVPKKAKLVQRCFSFHPENTEVEVNSRRRIKSLAHMETKNIVNFLGIKSSDALWKLWVSHAKLVSMNLRNI